MSTVTFGGGYMLAVWHNFSTIDISTTDLKCLTLYFVFFFFQFLNIILIHINAVLFAGAEILGGGFGPGSRGAEGAGGAAEEARAGAGGEGDRHCWARAQHHHPSGVPGETQCEEEERPLQEKQTDQAGPGQQLHQSALWWVLVATARLNSRLIIQVTDTFVCVYIYIVFYVL